MPTPPGWALISANYRLSIVLRPNWELEADSIKTNDS